MNKLSFDQIKTEILKRAKAVEACTSQYKRAENATTEKELLQVIYDNLAYCSDNKIIDNTLLSNFSAEELIGSGVGNSGKENSGFANSGYWNSGNRNSGNMNSGNMNSGDMNSGDSNSGYRNSGNRNSGDSNSGYWNSGNRNSGDSNSGYRNSGAFCTEPDPALYLFNKKSSMTVKQWEQSKAVNLMYSIYTTLWIPFSIMSEEEKTANPKAETTDGYLKTIPIKDAWANAWNNWSVENRKAFTDLENFDASIFEEITGIKI